MIDVTGTDLLEVLASKKSKTGGDLDFEDDPFNPNSHEAEPVEMMEPVMVEIEGVDSKILAVCREWRPDMVYHKLVARLHEKLPRDQADRIISQIKKPLVYEVLWERVEGKGFWR